MNNKFENGVLTVYPEGNIDSNNAEEFGRELEAIRNENPSGSLVLDLDELKYISSAGLRQILRLRKKEKSLKLINVSSEIYEIFDMTGFSEMMEIEKAYRRFSVEGCEVIGEGSNGIVYRINPDTIIKVYKNPDALEDIKKERELARTALVLGINTAIPYDVVKVGDKYGSVFELLSAKSLTKLIVSDPDNIEKYVHIFIDLLKEIHSTPVKEGLLPDARLRAINWCRELEGRIPEDTYRKLLNMLEAVPSSNNMIHGDYHTNNVHYANGEAILIDMDTLSVGNPVFELSNMFLAYHGFGEMDRSKVSNFLKLDWDMAQKVLELSFKYYFDDKTDDEITVYLNKAKTVGYMRLLRRTYKRESDNTAFIEHLKNRLIESVDSVDNLTV